MTEFLTKIPILVIEAGWIKINPEITLLSVFSIGIRFLYLLYMKAEVYESFWTTKVSRNLG